MFFITFFCAGHIPITHAPTTFSLPVVIHWNTRVDQHGRVGTVIFPPQISVQDAGEGGVAAARMEKLVKDAQPDAFRCDWLDPYQFTTSFHPANFGILDEISQVLLQTLMAEKGFQEVELQTRGVRAELLELNVCSGSSQEFQSRNMPRSSKHFGFLIVCLPYLCTSILISGGQLIVRRDGSTRSVDWGHKKPTTIEWAAFYCDCQHEILKVTTGYHITLTYSLYISESVGSVIGCNPTLDIKELPLFTTLKDFLKDKDFLPSGGVLGFCCTHEYFHTSSSLATRIPLVLRGIDMALYAAVKELGLHQDVLPVHDDFGIGGIDLTGTQRVHEDQERRRLERIRRIGYDID